MRGSRRALAGLLLVCCSRATEPAPGRSTDAPPVQTDTYAALHPPAYPLQVSADKRTLVDRKGVPFLVAGDSPQGLVVRLSPAEMRDYFAIRARQGFNAAWVNAIANKYTGGNAEATTYDGLAPFLAKLADGHYDLGKPNPAYFARVDAAVAAAAERGILVLLDPIETGGFLDTLRANGMDAAKSYGRYLGERYAAADNIVWLHGNDLKSWVSETDNDLVHAVALGIRAADARHLQTVELDYPKAMSSLDDAARWQDVLDINTTYTYAPTYAQLHVDYRRENHLPNVMIEANYEGENESRGAHLTNAHDCRTQYYWSVLAGATGSFYGNKAIWPMAPDWRAHMEDRGAVAIRHVQAFFTSRAWWRLIPDPDNRVVVEGFGDYATRGNAQDNTYATTARSADGTLVVTYMPTARSVTVDMTKLAGAATARWFNPTTGGHVPIAGSPFAATGTRTFTPPAARHADASDDWVLVLETEPPP